MIFYFSTSSKEKTKVRKLIKNKFDISEFGDEISSEDFQSLEKMGLLDGANLWVIPEGTKLLKTYEKMNIGDYVLAYVDGMYKYYGKIVYMMKNKKLAEKINTSSLTKISECIFFVDQFKEIKILREQFNKIYHKDDKFIPRGLYNIDDKIENLLREEFQLINPALKTNDIVQDNYLVENLNKVINTLGEDNIENMISQMSDEEFEEFINSFDSTASIQTKEGLKKIRKYNNEIIDNLKKRYNNRCQICGDSTVKDFGVSIVEGHHIEKFSINQNNKPENIMILCPNHHTLIHKCGDSIDLKNKVVKYSNGKEEKIIL
ncbi:HNH endonuclease [Clostridium chromiireducens]|uniref:HNH endonuclease n=1 Tax=Clostridium chromiireducens TaxID=225345 RepID=UPI003AF94E2C